MTTFFALLILVLFLVLIIGFIKPALVLRWSEKPTRLKVFGYWFLAIFIIAMISVATETD
ncbi:MAG: hypothetical protein K0B10_11020 [Vicingaceae bacterium]|nr:hypothetical protein [Vicingaceae bacterium]